MAEIEKWWPIIKAAGIKARGVAEKLHKSSSANIAPMSQMGQTRSFGDVASMSGLRESGHGSVIYECTPYMFPVRRQLPSN